MAAIMLEKKGLDFRALVFLLITCLAAVTMTALLSASRRPVSLASVSAFEKGASIQEKMARRVAQQELSHIDKVNADVWSQDPDANIHFHSSIKHKAKAAAVVPHHIELQSNKLATTTPVSPKVKQMPKVSIAKKAAPAHKQIKAPAQRMASAHVEKNAAARTATKSVQQVVHKAVNKAVHIQAKKAVMPSAHVQNKNMLKITDDKGTESDKSFLGDGPWVHVPTPKEMSGDGVGANHDGANGVPVNRWWDDKAMTFHGDQDCDEDQKSGPLGCDVSLGHHLDNRREWPNNPNLPTTYAPESGVSHHFLKNGDNKGQKLHKQQNTVAVVRQGLASLDTKRAARAPGLGMFAPVPKQALFQEVPQKKKCIGGEHGVCGDEVLDVHTDRREADVGMPADKFVAYMYGKRPRTARTMRMMRARTSQLAESDSVSESDSVKQARKEQESLLGQMEDDIMEASEGVGSFLSGNRAGAAKVVSTKSVSVSKAQKKQQQLAASAEAEKKPGQSCIGLVCSDEVLDSMDNLQVDKNDVTTKGNNVNNYFFDRQVHGSQILARPSYLDGGLVHHGISDVDSSADLNNFFDTMPQQ